MAGSSPTHTPSHSPHSHTLQLKDILALPSLIDADAEVLCGTDKLDTAIRWVHVVDSDRAGQLLNGGELLLTTGLNFGTTAQAQEKLIDGYVHAGAAALLVEVGTQIDKLPSAIVQRCKHHDLPLIVVYEEIRFVEITEAVHSAILNSQFEQVETLQHINESFWGLMFNGAPPEQLVIHASRQLERPVVLEDLNHRVILYVEGHYLPSRLLANWEEKSRVWAARTRNVGLVADPISVQDPDDPHINWTFIDIQAQGHHWGRLFVRDAFPEDSKVSHVLHHAAMALAIERLGASSPNAWTDLRERVGLDRLLHNRFTTVNGQKSVLESSGFHTQNRLVLAAEVRLEDRSLSPDHFRTVFTQVGPDIECLVSRHENDRSRIVCAISAEQHRRTLDQLISTIRKGLEKLDVPMELAVSDALGGPIDLGAALHRINTLRSHIPETGVRISRSTPDRIDGLLHYLHNDVRVQSFAETTLTPLLIHDQRNDTNLMDTLVVLLDYPASRSAAAAALHVSRTALYSRIATIERLLNVDLANGSQFFSLSLVVRSFFGS